MKTGEDLCVGGFSAGRLGDVDVFGVWDFWDYGVECRVVHKQNPCMTLSEVEVLQDKVQSHVDGIFTNLFALSDCRGPSKRPVISST